MTDRACHFGDGLFETIAVVQGKPCLWQQHLERLQQGLQKLALPPINWVKLRDDVTQACQSHSRAVLKIIVSAGHVVQGYQRAQPVTPHYVLRCTDWLTGPLYQTDTPIHLQLCQTRLGHQPQLAGIKHLNRLEQVLARNELQEGIAEGVMLDQAGKVIEGTMSNLLIQYGNDYITPPIEHCGIAGVVRHLLIEQAAVLGEPLKITPVNLTMLQQADAVYLMNSLLGIRQVATFEGHQYREISMPVFLQAVSEQCFIS